MTLSRWAEQRAADAAVTPAERSLWSLIVYETKRYLSNEGACSAEESPQVEALFDTPDTDGVAS